MVASAPAGGRLDAVVAARGLARSRSHAAALIAAGRVTVDGRSVVKPSTAVRADSVVAVAELDHYVSRGAHKLLAALDSFDIDPAGALALDVGASTGGFTQVLLERGARRVIALDVGHGQLSPRIAGDPRVVSVEGQNARELTAARLTELGGETERPSLVVGDLSFISLGLVVGALAASAAAGADHVLLVKPQFEVGRQGVREGVVRDARLREDAVSSVLWHAWDAGLGVAGLIGSPIAGQHGNLEYLAWFSASRGSSPSEWGDRVRQLTR